MQSEELESGLGELILAKLRAQNLGAGHAEDGLREAATPQQQNAVSHRRREAICRRG